jgi:hypothetical protein
MIRYQESEVLGNHHKEPDYLCYTNNTWQNLETSNKYIELYWYLDNRQYLHYTEWYLTYNWQYSIILNQKSLLKEHFKSRFFSSVGAIPVDIWQYLTIPNNTEQTWYCLVSFGIVTIMIPALSWHCHNAVLTVLCPSGIAMVMFTFCSLSENLRCLSGVTSGRSECQW